jgi:hypothetical protein
MSQFIDQLRGLSKAAYIEFSDVLDFIWKTPKLIESETKLEIRKLQTKFPLNGDPEHDAMSEKLRRMRWVHEHHKLENVFPYLMATGNLFSSISIFETYCLMLCKVVERNGGLSLSECSGAGLARLFKFCSYAGIDLERAVFRQQVNVAIKIRNCLFHANGLLSWSRDETELRRTVAKKHIFHPMCEPELRNWGWIFLTFELSMVRLGINSRSRMSTHMWPRAT